MYKKYLERFLVWLTPLKKEPPGLDRTIEEAQRAWKQALNNIHFVDNSLIDYAIHNLNATERRYMALIEEAKKERITAWPSDIMEVMEDKTAEVRVGETNEIV